MVQQHNNYKLSSYNTLKACRQQHISNTEHAYTITVTHIKYRACIHSTQDRDIFTLQPDGRFSMTVHDAIIK